MQTSSNYENLLKLKGTVVYNYSYPYTEPVVELYGILLIRLHVTATGAGSQFSNPLGMSSEKPQKLSAERDGMRIMYTITCEDCVTFNEIDRWFK